MVQFRIYLYFILDSVFLFLNANKLSETIRVDPWDPFPSPILPSLFRKLKGEPHHLLTSSYIYGYGTSTPLILRHISASAIFMISIGCHTVFLQSGEPN